jgi:two-component system sensor histidine kinase TctE
VYFRDESVRSREVRTAFMYAQVRGMPGAALVQVAETDEKRAALASRIIEGLLAAQFVLLPLALVLVWSGLRQGMKPLNELTDAIRERRPHDLSPLDPGLVPEELRPFIDSINGLMSRLEASLKLQQRFVADAAHQMRTPLAGLRTQAELALRQRDLESLQHNLRQIASGADRASRLISQLLSLARAEGDAPALEPVELNGLVQAASGSWVSLALERGIDLGFETAGRACWIDGNDVLLQELLNNLIDNALRYTERDGRVTTRVVAGDEVVLEVEDDGVGIEAAERELVFERFYRVLGTRSEGTGLGLAIVRGIAEAHHARIELLDRRGSRGTLMRITFPYRIAFDATSIAA